jgi:hypothetical protein
MTSIRKLEKMLEPYWIGGGASSEFTMYDEYTKGKITVRIDDYYETPYKTQLKNAVKKLGLISDKQK